MFAQYRPHDVRQAEKSQPDLRLRIGRYRLSFQTLTDVHLPAYAGSAWRGVFGHALKGAVCVTHERDCSQCLLYRSCAYPYIFETPPPPDTDRMRRYTAAPHPFVIYPLKSDRRTLPVQDTIGLELTLFGRSLDHLPYMIHAFRSAGKRGIGAGHGRFRLQRVEQGTWDSNTPWLTIWEDGGQLMLAETTMPAIPPCPEQLQLELISPLRLKRNEHLVRPEAFAFHDLFRNLLRRISMLMYFHENKPLEVDFADLVQLARAVPFVSSDLQWQEWTRYSSRQRTTMKMGGLIGRIDLDGANLEPFWPYLWLGQWTHAGKGTSMGLGRYRSLAVASLPNQTAADV